MSKNKAKSLKHCLSDSCITDTLNIFRLNQHANVTKTFERRNSTQRRTSLTESVTGSVQRLSRGFSVPAFFGTKRTSKGTYHQWRLVGLKRA